MFETDFRMHEVIDNEKGERGAEEGSWLISMQKEQGSERLAPQISEMERK